MSSGRVLLADKVDPMLELAMHVSVKAKNPFLRIRKKMRPFPNLEVGKQSQLEIVEVDFPT